ncbi:MAG: hypothetical protein K6A44_03515 [bacterium]|nr:hypothetical protein [bacterium]
MTEQVNFNTQSRTYHKDVRPQLARFQSQLPRHGMTIHINILPKGIYDEVKSYASKDGSFSRLNEMAYSKALLAQKIADANGDQKITDDEVEIYDEIAQLYGEPVIGGVEYSPEDLSKISSIAKNADGSYKVNYTENQENFSGVYVADNSGKPVKFSSSVFNHIVSDTNNKLASL